MGKNKDQGTEWETANVKAFRALSRFANRIEEGGIGDIGDVLVEGHFGSDDEMPKVAVAWKRYWLPEGAKRRKTRKVAIIDHDLFVEMVAQLRYAWVIECKASQAESVTTLLTRAEAKVKRNWDGRQKERR